MKTELRWGVFCIGALFLGTMLAQGQQTNAFVYQGVFNVSNQPASGVFGARFELYDAPTAGNRIGPSLTSLLTVSNGVFTRYLDFGQNVFTGQGRWLEIAVKQESTNPYTVLSPRQGIFPVPYALYAPQAGAASVAAGSVTGSQIASETITSGNIASSTITGANIANGQVVRSVNGQTDTVVLADWSRTGNAGTTAGANFLGTTDNQALELKVNNARALRLEPTTNTPNVLGGSSNNWIAAGVFGAVIAGGGGSMTNSNVISAPFATISGGAGNVIQSNAIYAVIGGGFSNVIDVYAMNSTIGGGFGNMIQTNATNCVIVGGFTNTIQSNALNCVIAGGSNNMIMFGATNCVIGGGASNTVYAWARQSTIPGGMSNWVAGVGSFAAGTGARAIHEGCFVWSDARHAPLSSSNTNQFIVRASGGTTFYTDSAGAVGVALLPFATSWTLTSDRNVKENFQPVDPREVLEKIINMPITEWNVISDPAKLRHIGPMAQDFKAAFDLGTDDRHINSGDMDGVTLAAIQGLYKVVKEKDAEIKALEKKAARVDELEARLAELEKRLKAH